MLLTWSRPDENFASWVGDVDFTKVEEDVTVIGKLNGVPRPWLALFNLLERQSKRSNLSLSTRLDPSRGAEDLSQQTKLLSRRKSFELPLPL